MEAVAQENKTLVRSLLGKLEEVGQNITWRINNTYSNGIDNTVLEIQIFENKIQTGRIAFQLEDGHVINYRYKDLEKRLPIQIMDMLLDVIGYELDHA
ncbi:hypothetical protein BFP97_11840 [Roseivirga sp. 4D4]|uniref:hypothetical protein n=1 Tax=Roseivirga sp. 4D4 TaxID=1889784 RepID=UPI0008537BEA|nr:hypothetical protein [Roseivirga sp. 4D4]OEK02171.1 hypothetical protein BFP97_11840 [Roseivirga sp. 4D4]